MAGANVWRSPRPGRPAAARPAIGKPLKPMRAALLYEYEERPYLMSLRRTEKKQVLRRECLPTVAEVAVHSLLYVCEPQRRYEGQCDLMLQSPTVEGKRELLTGLRAVPVPQDASRIVSALYVADYRPHEGARAKGAKSPPASAAVVLEGRSTSERPGWLLVLVMGENYNRSSRAANEVTAAAGVRAVLPMLPQWLEILEPLNV